MEITSVLGSREERWRIRNAHLVMIKGRCQQKFITCGQGFYYSALLPLVGILLVEQWEASGICAALFTENAAEIQMHFKRRWTVPQYGSLAQPKLSFSKWKFAQPKWIRGEFVCICNFSVLNLGIPEESRDDSQCKLNMLQKQYLRTDINKLVLAALNRVCWTWTFCLYTIS